MPISHICSECGFDLARVRAQREPRYGLPLVRCPNCPAFSVRVVHPAWRAWRRFLRLKTSLLVLLLQLGLLFTFIGFTSALCLAFGRVLVEHPDLLTTLDERASLALALVVLYAIALGTWLTAGLRHWNAPAAWLAFTVVMTCILAIDTVVLQTIGLVVRRIGPPLPVEPYLFVQYGWRMVALLSIMLAALLGAVPGHMIIWLIDRVHTYSWGARRRRFRARRTTA